MSEVKFPAYAIGTWAWGNGTAGSQMIFGEKRDTERLKAAFRTAVSEGFTLWDTAEVYGMGSSERLLRECVEECGEKILISTKHMPKKRYSSGEVRTALLGSLERLGADRADIYWLHLPFNIGQNINECAELAKEGKIGLIGLSNYNAEQIDKADMLLREKGLRVGAVQNHFSLIRRDPEQLRILDWCRKNDVPYFAYMVLEQGALSGKYDDEHPIKGLSLRSLEYNRNVMKKLRPLIDCLRELGVKYSVSPAQISVAWARSKGTIPIVGITKPEQAAELAGSASVAVTAEEAARLEGLADASGIVSRGMWEPKLPKF